MIKNPLPGNATVDEAYWRYLCLRRCCSHLLWVFRSGSCFADRTTIRLPSRAEATRVGPVAAARAQVAAAPRPMEVTTPLPPEARSVVHRPAGARRPGGAAREKPGWRWPQTGDTRSARGARCE